MAQISFRVPEEIAEELERGRIAQRYASQVEYLTALILDGAARVSGLAPPTAFDTAATDTRIGGAITDAISHIDAGESARAIENLRFAQRVIMESLVKAKPAIDKTVSERLRIRGGSDDWSEAVRKDQ